jgi:hypothetical protein
MAGLEDSLTLALHGPTFDLDWSVEVEGVSLKCHYWSGPYNDTRIHLSIPLANPKPTGKDCEEYVDGLTRPCKFWKDYPEDDDPNNPRNFHLIPGGREHCGAVSFEVNFYRPGTPEESIRGRPANSPFALVDSNLSALCDYDCCQEWEADDGQKRVAGPYTLLKPHVARAVVESWKAALAERDRRMRGPVPESVPGPFCRLYDLACSDTVYDTGLRLRGFQVVARGLELYLEHPEEFATEAIRLADNSGDPYWAVGYTRPDGVRQVTYLSYKSLAEAENARNTYRGAKSARLRCRFVVEYRIGNRSSDRQHGRPWGTTWWSEGGYLPFRFDLTEQEAAVVLDFVDEVGGELRRRSEVAARAQYVRNNPCR